MPRILLVEDDSEFAEKVNMLLSLERYVIDVIPNGADAMYALKNSSYDLLIVDWHLPEVTGVEIVKRYRALGGVAPILMLTGETSMDSKESGLDSGADDYLTKPFHVRELLARVRALLRRPKDFAGEELAVGTMHMDLKSHKVTNNSREIQLLPLEFNLLEFFLRHPDEVFSLEALLSRVWPSSSEASTETVRTYIKTLRQKVNSEDSSVSLANVHSVGYKLDTKK